MKLYHGTDIDFDVIDLMESKPNKDFGQGFYLSKELEQARSQAKARSKLSKRKPIVQCYEFDEKLLKSKDLNILQFNGYTKDWAKFVLMNRHNKADTPAHNYDIVIGPIADDQVGFQLLRYLRRDIDIQTLTKNLKYMKGMTIQYFFGTQKAISYLHRIYEKER